MLRRRTINKLKFVGLPQWHLIQTMNDKLVLPAESVCVASRAAVSRPAPSSSCPGVLKFSTALPALFSDGRVRPTNVGREARTPSLVTASMAATPVLPSLAKQPWSSRSRSTFSVLRRARCAKSTCNYCMHPEEFGTWKVVSAEA